MKQKQNKTVGYGFVGLWRDNKKPGWWMPNHIHDFDRRGNSAGIRREFLIYGQDTDRAVLCKITVEQVFDKRGRPITRTPYPSADRKNSTEALP